MKEFAIEGLARIIGAEPTKNLEGSFRGISIDSRTTRVGDCFFAIAGDNFDGHNYIAEALRAGAACAVVSKDFEVTCPGEKVILRVSKTEKALGDFGREYRRQGGFKVVAITGSAGKTTVRQIAYQVLRRHFRCHAAPKNFNNAIGLPLTLLGADVEDDLVVAELGSNNVGEIGYLTRIAEPDAAVVTNVYASHLEGFGDLETIIREKLSISEGLRDGGDFFINGDCNRLTEACRSSGAAFKTFGISEKCDIRAENIVQAGLVSRFTIDETLISLPLPGAGNVENALAAWAICSGFGVGIGDFAEGVRGVRAVRMRAEPLQIGRLTVLNDCYNANPASMKNALEVLTRLGSEQGRRTVFICGDMAELGKAGEKLHAELGSSIAEAKVGLVLAVGKFAETVAGAARENARNDLKTKCFEDALSACKKLGDLIKDSDIVLVKGSRSVKLEATIERLKECFS